MLSMEEITSEIAGYRFRDDALLLNALTHSSYLHEHTAEADARDFERLEFLGDAVVDLVVGEELFRRFPDATEGELTALRAALVSSAALADVGRRLGLPERARLGRGEEETGGRQRGGLAASLYESVVGAVYLEGGLDEARQVVRRTMGDAIAATATLTRRSPKAALQEWAQAERHPLPMYRTLSVTGPEHRRDFVVEVAVAGNVAQGTGPSKRAAEEAAAQKLLEVVTK
ncbi:MAG: ribonuclease III [Chloroflexi bacterium]|nr:MAG: ribonuclease III [Chloroflexota bacterium]